MKKFTLIISVLIIFKLIFTGSVFAYSNSSAVSYADKYAVSPNRLNSLGQGYNYYSNDCTNFVSQCFYTGGLSQDSTWRSYVTYSVNTPTRHDSTAWTVAESFKNYVRDTGRAWKLGSSTLNGTPDPYLSYPYTNNSANLVSTNAGRTVIFYDWDGDGTMNHAAIYVVNNGSSTYSGEGSGDLIDQHTSNRKHVLWRPDRRQSSSKKYTTRVYAFQLNV